MSARGDRDAHVLVTGFGPFADVRVNASGVVATSLDGAVVGGVGVRGVVLPTAFGEARATIAGLAQHEACVGAVALGVWRGNEVRLERRARGIVTSEHADVRGEVWLGRELGAEMTTTVPIDEWAEAVGSWVSEDCGGYVCNAVYQALLEAIAGRSRAPRGAGRQAVFMHVPRDVGVRGVAATRAMVHAVVERVARMSGADHAR